MDSNEAVDGARVVSRVAALLRAVSSAAPGGATATELAVLTGFSRPTTHRILISLAGEGFVDREGSPARWFVGPELSLLQAPAADRYDVTDLALDDVRALAERTGESAFFSARRGDETVCLLREEGSFPIRSFVLFEGVRFPLGVASAGLVLLSFLDDDDVERYAGDDRLVERFGPAHATKRVRSRIAVTRQAGYSVNPGLILEESWGMGAAVFDETGHPAWALSLTGVTSRFRPARQAELGALLLHHAHEVSVKIRNRSEARGGSVSRLQRPGQ